MAVTGVILVLFLLGHTLGNLQVFLGRDVFNQYAYFLHSTGELLWVFRAVMILAAILHIITSVRLKLYNNQAKPQNTL
jgi:succinate dehydrogenase / fumarate reductase cytochrome b subunit